jgi:uncharacterized membrane protein
VRVATASAPRLAVSMNRIEGHTTASESSPPHAVPNRIGMVITALAFFAYFVTLHLLIVRHATPSTTLTLVGIPWLFAIVAGLRALLRSTFGARRAIVAIGASIVALIAAWIAVHFGQQLLDRLNLLLYLESVAFLGSLSIMFAITLRGPGEPLVTRLARSTRRGDMPAQVVRYTRVVTIGWAAFFAIAASISTILFFTQSSTIWSSFVNLMIWPLVIALFAIEYAIRLRVLTDVRHGSIMASVTAFRQHAASDDTFDHGKRE